MEMLNEIDILEEQRNEVFAIGAIYSDYINLITKEPPAKFAIRVQSDNYKNNPDDGLSCTLVFTHTPNYPNELPIIEIKDVERFDETELQGHVNQLAKENLGMVMVFAIVSSTQEWINQKWDVVLENKRNLLFIEKKEQEDAEKKKFEGTPVTVTTFLEWNRKFEKELMEKKSLLEKNHRYNNFKKLTGKEQFMRDKSLINSDLQFLEDIKIDETLFEAVEDLDLLDESDDDAELDSDYVPEKDSDDE